MLFSKTGNRFIIIRKFYKFLKNKTYSVICVNILKKTNTMVFCIIFVRKYAKHLFENKRK
ncbi:hypothetical protein COF63_23985 [Bacillus pseudomycoides]|nr:hypothetical protein CON86_24540 [Bacillus pseudomycoides]PEM78595.1 hypothetical protein CN632_06895 [Bacillus pseudomycoides]PHC80941.1 hypothetical protein COF63_23985 [Bacillus pseudomycoides]